MTADGSGNCQYSFPACYGLRHRRCRYFCLFCRSARMQFLPPVRRRCFALVVTSFISFIFVSARKLIHFAAPPLPKKSCDFSGTPRSSQNHIPFSRSFSCQPTFGQQKKPVHPDGMYRPKIVRLLPCLEEG